jgi:adenylyltransferase/sulfurtransferase
MLKAIQKAFRKLIYKCVTLIVRRRLPRAAPSAEGAILLFNPAEYAIHPQSLKQMLDDEKEFILLDVREEWEYRTVHIDGALWIPLGELPQRAYELNLYAEIVIYCHRGMRSLDAAYLLQQLGFKRIKSLVGGIDHWAQEIDPTLYRY